jgi:iron complex transport system permease protein
MQSSTVQTHASPTRKFRKTFPIILLLLLPLAIVAMVILGTLYGDVPLDTKQAISVLWQRDDSLESEIVWEYRLPRIIVGIFVGMNFAVAGALFQAATRNPLAAPNIIGISAGAGFFAVMAMILIPNFPGAGLPFAAFAGAALAGVIVYLVAWKKGVSPARLALSGIALDSLFQAATTGILVYSTDGVDAAIVWLSGSLWGRGWEQVGMIWPWSLVGLSAAWLLAYRVNIMTLSEEISISLGLPVERYRMILLFIGTLLSASAVAVSGPIGFVGLVIPHLARLLVGANYKLVIPVSAFLGALLVMIGDLLGRTIMAPIEIPVGVFTALIGAPYFIYLLRKSRRG